MAQAKAIVTGGAGFIGSHVVDALLASDYRVLVVDDLSSGSEENLASAARESGALSLIKKDICNPSLRADIHEFSPEVIFHFAAQMNVRRSVEEPVFDCEKNVLGTVSLLEAARLEGVKKFIFASTGGAIYGEQDSFPATEEHQILPECPYGVSKRGAELYLEYSSRAHSMAAVSLRFANVYGPRQNPKGEAGVVAIFMERLLAGDKLGVNGDGEQTRDYVYVEDVVSANMLAASKIHDPGFYVFNVGTGKESSVLELVERLRASWKELLHEDPRYYEFEAVHRPALAGEQRRSVISADKLSQELGWSAKTDFQQGITKTLAETIASEAQR